MSAAAVEGSLGRSHLFYGAGEVIFTASLYPLAPTLSGQRARISFGKVSRTFFVWPRSTCRASTWKTAFAASVGLTGRVFFSPSAIVARNSSSERVALSG